MIAVCGEVYPGLREHLANIISVEE